MKEEALNFIERYKETTKKSHYVPHGSGIDDMLVREDYEVESLPFYRAKDAIDIALKGTLPDKWKYISVKPDDTCQILLYITGQIILGAYGKEYDMFYSDNDSSFKSCKWNELPNGQWLNVSEILPKN